MRKTNYYISCASFIVFITFNLFCNKSLLAQEKQVLNRKTFYKALSSNDLKSLEIEISKIQDVPELLGYEGALQMRKAGIVSGLTKKYNYFKTGAEQLEKAIANNPQNTELKFLRLMIQEQAPTLLNYNDNIKTDGQEVKKHFDSFSSETQKAIIGYCESSKILKKEDFKI